jgi:hypothetical protein
VTSKSKSSTRLRILHGINDTQIGVDAERAEILDIRHVMRLERRLVDQKLEGDPLAVRQSRAGRP